MSTLVTPTYPGVYVEELFSLSLSVNASATAVPVFADGINAGSPAVVRINSWLEFLAAVKSFDPRRLIHRCLRAYFENGGGYCYLVPVDKLIAEVPKLDDVTLLVAAGQDISGAVAQLCGPGKSLFAILDTSDLTPEELKNLADSKSSAATPAGGKKKNNASDVAAEGVVVVADVPVMPYPPEPNMHTAIYYPWLQATWANGIVEADENGEGGAEYKDKYIPPSAAVAGIYCSVDRERGVWKAPANVALKGGLTPKYKISDAQQGDYMEGTNALNMIREFRNAGTLVWGARTLDDTNNWTYVPLRRLFDAAERDIKKAMRFAVYEPNTGSTWTRVKSAIDSYLHGLWKQGGLMGAKPEEGFFVQIGEDVTMTPVDIEKGRMIVKIGLAPVRPAEFIILQFTQEMTQA